MTYLITGGTGTIGSYTVRNLVKGGERVVIYDLFPEVSLLEALLTDEERSSIKIIRGDVTDLTSLLHAVQDNKADIVIHLAAIMGLPANANPSMATRINCEGTVNVFETARILGLKKVVWASSTTVFGPHEKYPDGRITNDAPHHPLGIYGASKSYAETVANLYFEEFNVDSSAIRYAFVYGPGQRTGRQVDILRELVEKPALGKPGRVPFSEDTMNWFYVDDAARVTVLVTKTPKTKTRAYNVSGDIHSVKEATDYVKKLLPGADISLLPGRIGISSNFDAAVIEQELGFRPEWPLEKALEYMINSVRRQHGLPSV